LDGQRRFVDALWRFHWRGSFPKRDGRGLWYRGQIGGGFSGEERARHMKPRNPTLWLGRVAPAGCTPCAGALVAPEPRPKHCPSLCSVECLFPRSRRPKQPNQSVTPPSFSFGPPVLVILQCGGADSYDGRTCCVDDFECVTLADCYAEVRASA